jgi:hypothetical protein
MRWWLACLLAGCEFSHGTASGVPDDGKKLIDAPPDAPPDALLNPMCFGPPGPYQVCLNAIPTNQTTLNSMPIDTDACDGDATNEQKMTLNGVTVCVIAGSTITVNGIVQASGPNPLVLASTQSITIGMGATLSVASISGSNPVKGASANDGSCAGTSTFGIGGAGGGGGGAGGTFGGAGGAGGTGSLGVIAGGMAAPVGPPITTLRGGCEGGDGGDASNSAVGDGAPGGNSGGALYLATQGVLTIQGTVTASGGGGYGATSSKQGGGGAGSGGMIAIAAHSLMVPASGVVIANGGGGGGGASNGANGGDGANPASVAAQAIGGTGGALGGSDGGKGAAGAAAATAGLPAGQGAGGGGGGLGIIKVLTRVTLPATQISPPQS